MLIWKEACLLKVALKFYDNYPRLTQESSFI